MAAATTSRKCHGALRRLLCGAACLASAVPARRSPPRRCHVPPESHRVLVTREGSRTILVGDVHGCLDELKSLLQACGYDASTDHVVLVGDLVNKGPHSAEAVAYARESGFACVRGNHDDAALFAHEARSEAGARGSDSKYSELKYAWVDALGEADLAFLRELPHTLRLEREEVLVVHAGVVPGVPLAEQRAEDMTTMRNLVRADGGGWWAAASASAAGVAWAEEWRPEPTVVAGVRHVVFGHDAKRRLQRHEHATGLDTGCCYGGELTALVLPEWRLVAVDAGREYTVPGG